MICDGEDLVLTEDRLSSQLAPPPIEIAVVGKAKQVPQGCESFGDINCDLGTPDGEPRVPRTLETQRSEAALVTGSLPPITPRGARLYGAHIVNTNSSGFIENLFRPPRSS